jgi:hypothetical protein
MRTAALSLILLSVSALGTAQSTDEFRTGGSLNGRAWKVMEANTKSLYVIGALEGMINVITDTVKNSVDVKLALQVYYPVELKPNEVRDAVDRFFAEPENLLMSVGDALRIISMKARGLPEKEIEAKISIFRATASTAPERKQ